MIAKKTKEWLPFVNKRVSKTMLSLDSKDLGGMIAHITGYDHLKYFAHKCKEVDNNLCRRCDEVPETLTHILECKGGLKKH